jgi:hypothetical protein
VKSKIIIASILVLASSCKQDPPTEAPATAAQTAVQAVEEKPSVYGAEFMDMSDEAQATLIKSGDPTKVRDIVSYKLYEFGNAAGEGSVGPLQVGNKKVEQPLMIGLRQSRMLVAKLGGAPSDCDVECQNTHLNQVAEPLTGGLLYKADGSVDSAMLKILIEKVQFGAGDTVLGIPATAVYASFKPTLREYALVFRTLNKIGPDVVKGEFEAALADAGDDKDAMSTFYRRFVNMNDVVGQSGLQKSNRHAVATGFWMRRMADGTLPLIEETLKKTLVEFDKPLHDEVFSAK